MKEAVAASLVGEVEEVVRAPLAAELEARFRFEPDLEVFAGHFPGRPLVPGVFLLEAARLTCARGLGRSLRIVRVARAKFSAEVAPDGEVAAEVTVKVALSRAGDASDPPWQARVRILTADDREAATLRLELR